LLNVAHGLGAIPTLIQVVLRCTTADLNYSQNDEVPIYATHMSASADKGMNVGADSTNVFIVQGVNINLLDKTGFNDASVTTTSWRWVVRAWK
jgi:hypothetical protein